MKKLIIFIGPSGCGKSTKASDMVRHNPELYTIVNRDKIRELLFGYTESTVSEYYQRNDINKLEKEVTKYENLLIKEILVTGKIPIIDSTNLKRQSLTRFKYFNVPVELKLFDTDKQTAIERDSNRIRKVGKEVINRQFSQYKSLKDSLNSKPIYFGTYIIENNPNKPPCYVFDIDGTLAHKGDRSPYDWKKVGEDTTDKSICSIFNILEGINSYSIDKLGIVVATGRDAVCREETENWLQDNSIYPTEDIIMRPEGDFRPDWEIKREMAEAICEKYYIVGWFDDRMQVTDYLRSIGIKVLNVEYNNF